MTIVPNEYVTWVIDRAKATPNGVEYNLQKEYVYSKSGQDPIRIQGVVWLDGKKIADSNERVIISRVTRKKAGNFYWESRESWD